MKEKFKSFCGALGYFLLVFVIQIVVSALIGMILGVMFVLNNPDALSNVEKMSSYILQFTNPIIIISDILAVLAIILIYHLKKRQIKKELLIIKTKRVNLLTAVLLGASVWCINSGVLSIVESLDLFKNAFETFSETTSAVISGNYIISLLGTIIIVPFAEEFLFRGVIYRTLDRRFSIATTIIIQAVLFGILHGNLIQGTYATFLGIAFGYITYKSQSIWPAVICHMVNNGIAMILPNLLSAKLDTMLFYIFLFVIGVIAFTVSILLINKNNKKDINTISFINNI